MKIKTIWDKLTRKEANLPMAGNDGVGLPRWSWIQSLMMQLGAFQNTRTDYEREVGDLSLSSLVMAAVNWMGTAMPEAPLIVEAPDGKGYQRIAGHEMEMLWAQPNAYYSGENYAHAMAYSWLVDGNVYFYKVRNFAGQVVELWYLPHFTIAPQYNPLSTSPFITKYLYSVNGKEVELAVDDVIHIRRGVDPANPRKGIGVVRPLLREVYIDNEASNFSATTFKNLGLPSFVISPSDTQATLDKDMREDMRKKYEDEFRGDGRGRVLIASKRVELHQLSFDPDKMDTRNNRIIAEERWAALTGIPAIVLQFGAGLEHSTYSNYEQALQQAYKGFLLPSLRQIAPQLTRQLLVEFKSDYRSRVRFFTDEMQILQEDRNALSKRILEEWKSDLITRGEARVTLDREMLPGDENLFFSPYRQQFLRMNADTDKTSNDDATKQDKAIEIKAQSAKAAEAEARDWWQAFAPDAASELLEAEIDDGDDE